MAGPTIQEITDSFLKSLGEYAGRHDISFDEAFDMAGKLILLRKEDKN
jgi:hypothetical protein